MPKRKQSAAPRIVARAKLPTRFGNFEILGIKGRGENEEAVALIRGNLTKKSRNGREQAAPLVRIHSQCLTGDVLASERCDCRAQLELSLSKIGKAPAGVLLYLPQEGRGIGLMNKLRAYQLQDSGMDTVEANRSLGFADDARNYSFSAAILKLLGAKNVRLLSNNPDKVSQISTHKKAKARPSTNRPLKPSYRWRPRRLFSAAPLRIPPHAHFSRIDIRRSLASRRYQQPKLFVNKKNPREPNRFARASAELNY
jgi:GTP cyclohydrolase II